MDKLGDLPEPGTPGHGGGGGGGERHHRTHSSLADLSMLEIQLPPEEKKDEGKAVLAEVPLLEDKKGRALLPKSHLIIVTETVNLEGGEGGAAGGHKRTESQKMFSSLTDFDYEMHGKLKVKNWTGKKFYSDYIAEGLEYKKEKKDVVMLFESPSSSTSESSFHNKSAFKFHDWPPPTSMKSKAVLGPCRYALMNGPSFPAFLKEGAPPEGLVEHWKQSVPGFKEGTFVPKIHHEEQTVYAYLPVEQLPKHINERETHYHLAGKDAIHLMTQKTTKLLPDTKTVRPCVVKTTHSMGSKGIFVIQDDEDEAEFETFLEESGHPTFVVTDFVDIARNVACHFFMHPDGETVVWFGSNENKRDENEKFTSDSYLVMSEQEELKKIQLPFVEEVVKYCHGLGFWGFCGVDVVFDANGLGYLVDINPRVTGSCPALMTLSQLKKEYGFTVGLFRRSGHIYYFGKAKELLESVTEYNKDNEGKSRVVIHSYFQPAADADLTRVNIGVYGNDMEQCTTVLNSYAHPPPVPTE